jgi:hypothetical protein
MRAAARKLGRLAVPCHTGTMLAPSSHDRAVRRPAAGSLALAVALALVMATPRLVQARREVTFNYPYSRVWTSAVRLMRVDFACTITEKDKEDGYFLFEYPDHGKTFPGSVEFVAGKDEDVDTVRVVIQVAAMPSYVEGMMMDRLARKLEQEFGPPKEPKRPAAKEDPDHPSEGDKGKDAPAKPKPGAADKP